jgi:hypothetical protein
VDVFGAQLFVAGGERLRAFIISPHGISYLSPALVMHGPSQVIALHPPRNRKKHACPPADGLVKREWWVPAGTLNMITARGRSRATGKLSPRVCPTAYSSRH